MTEVVLIGSMRRSGGTLVANLFDGHPDCSVLPFEDWHTRRKARFFPHHNFLFPLLPPGAKLYACGFRNASYRRKLELWQPGADHAGYERELRACAARATSVSGFYLDSCALYFRFFHGSELRAKLVNHCADLCTLAPWQLRRIYGAHRMILPVRDPRAVFCSMIHLKTGRFSERSLASFCARWERSVNRYYLGDPSVLAFRYEDLLVEPKATMEALSHGLGIPFSEVLLRPTRQEREAGANTSFERGAGIDASAADAWRSRLAAPLREQIERRLGPLMQRLGYAR
jgi:hypothetical protein